MTQLVSTEAFLSLLGFVSLGFSPIGSLSSGDLGAVTETTHMVTRNITQSMHIQKEGVSKPSSLTAVRSQDHLSTEKRFMEIIKL